MTAMQQPPPAMFSRTGSGDFPDHLKVMVTGPPKSGKTFLLGTVPNILILDTEPHANNLQSVAHLNLPYKTITRTDDLRQVQFLLSQKDFREGVAHGLGMPSIDAVAIDTLDTLQGIMKRERMTEKRQSQFLRDDWGWLKEEMISIIEAFTSLPMHVFFMVHTKTKEVGTEKEPRTIILPGLEGAIAESIAGMVGYSLLSFRKEELDLASGRRFTKYWLRAEGDETYEFLGNRAAGRLPDVIEPQFKTIYDAAMANRPQQATQQIQVGNQAPPAPQQTAATPPPQPASQPAPAAQPIQTPVQNAPEVTPNEAPAQNAGQAPAPQPEAQSGATQQPTQPTQQQPATRPTGNPPATEDTAINATALGFVKKVYDAIQVPMPEDKIRSLLTSEAREVVQSWRALQADEAAGQGGDVSAVDQMKLYLKGIDLLPEEGATQAPEPEVQAKIDGTIPEVKKYVGDNDADPETLSRAQAAYDLEVKKASPRSGLITWLESKGVTPPQAPAPAATPAPAPEVAQTAVTPEAAPADGAVTEEQGLATVKEQLGAEVISTGVDSDTKCEVCGNPVDDVDLAELGRKRFDKTLCVKDYIAEGKK